MLNLLFTDDKNSASKKARTAIEIPSYPLKDDVDILNVSNEVEITKKTMDSEDLLEGKALMPDVSQTLTANTCDNSGVVRNDQSLLGRSSASVEELELSCDSSSKNVSRSKKDIHNSTDRSANSLVDNSCIILDYSNTQENISEIFLGDSESQEEDTDNEQKGRQIKREGTTEEDKEQQKFIHKQKTVVEESSIPLFTKASNVPFKKMDSISDTSSSESFFFQGNTDGSNTRKQGVNTMKQNEGLSRNLNDTKKEHLATSTENKNKVTNSNNREVSTPVSFPLMRLGTFAAESGSNTASTGGSGNSGISADDEATHSALPNEGEHRSFNSLSCSSRPGSSLMYADSPSQTSAWGSDVSPITKPNMGEICKQDTFENANTSSSALPSYKLHGIGNKVVENTDGDLSRENIISTSLQMLTGRKYSTPGRNNQPERHLVKGRGNINSRKSIAHKEIHSTRKKTAEYDITEIENGSTDEEPPKGENRKPPISPHKKKSHINEHDQMCTEKNKTGSLDTIQMAKNDTNISNEYPSSQNELFKTPHCSISSPMMYGTTNTPQECHLVSFKISDLEVVKVKWPEAYGFLFSKRLNTQKLDTNSQAAISKEGRRMSDVSSLSSNSRSSGSAGYLADIGTSSSSGASTASFISGKAKRDRLSIDPEAAIRKGGLIAPLPNPKPSRPSQVIEEEESQASICSTIALVGSQVALKNACDEDCSKNPTLESNNVDGAGIHERRRSHELIPIKTRGKKKLSKSTRNSQNRVLTENKLEDIYVLHSQEIPVQEQLHVGSSTRPLLKKGMQVFAKWTQKTDVRYYPGVIENTGDNEDTAENDNDKKFYVKFDDGFEKGGLRWDDMIPVGMLEMGNAVNVEDSDMDEGIHYSAVLSAYPEFVREEEESDEENRTNVEVMYTVDYEKPKEGCSVPQFDTERISYKRVFLNKQQAIAIKKGLGGYWNAPTSCNSVAEMSLDNLVSGKRRSKVSSAPSKTSTTKNTPQKNKMVLLGDQSPQPKSLRSASSKGSTKITLKTPSKNHTVFYKEPHEARKTSSCKKNMKRGGNCVETSVAEDEEDINVDIAKRKVIRKTSGTAAKSNCGLSTTEEESAERSPTRLDRRKRKFSRLVIEPTTTALTKRSGSKSLNQLFEGLHFVLTQGSKTPSADQRNIVETDMTSAMETETEGEMVDAIPKESSPSEAFGFDRKKLREVIVKHGGVVLEAFPGGTHTPFPQPYITDNGQQVSKLVVVSDRYCQTMSFLLAIGFGIIRISHLWVLQSATEGKLQPMKNYYLPVGWSMTEDREIEQNEHNCGGKSKVGIFVGSHILISSLNSNYIGDWKPLLARLGATISCRSKGKLDKSLKAIDVVVVDERNTSKTIIQSAIDKNIPIVTATWIIQSLINGSKIPCGNFLFSPTDD